MISAAKSQAASIPSPNFGGGARTGRVTQASATRHRPGRPDADRPAFERTLEAAQLLHAISLFDALVSSVGRLRGGSGKEVELCVPRADRFGSASGEHPTQIEAVALFT